MTIASRRERIYYAFPDPVTGYELNPDFSPFTIIVPEATVNLVTNPSVEGKVTTGYAAVGGAMAADYGWQAYGACGLKLTPAVSTESGFYFGTVAMAAGSTYTASITIQGEAGKVYYIYLATTAGALLGSKRLWLGTGHKQRIWVTFPEPTGASRRVYVTRSAQYTDQNLFYADGLQVEAKPYPTTYCDGSLYGFVRGQYDFYWNGRPGASTSTRTDQTRAGGREMNLLGYGFRVLAIIGLGMATLVDQALPMPGRGELPQGTGTMAREFTLVGALNFDGPRHGQALRDDLINVFKPDSTVIEQPMLLRYQACDDEGEQTGESLDIICKYRQGLEGNIDNNHQERIALHFKQYLPYMRGTYSGGTELGYQEPVTNANYILMRSGATGQWQAMGTGAGAQVNALAPDHMGNVYVGGNFTNLTDANGDYISIWNGTAFSSLGTGMNAGVNSLVIGPDWNLYAGGNFSLAGGVANTSKIAKWDGSVWTPLGTGANGAISTLAIGPDGMLYAGGAFHLAGGVAGTVHIAKWDGSVWTPLGTGVNSDVYALAIGPDGSLYAGGDFTNAGGVPNTAHIAKWNGSVWSALGTGANDIVNSLVIGPDGILYAGGFFTLAGGVANTVRIAKWNGSVWSPLGTGMNHEVYALTIGPGGFLYAAGFFTIAGGVALPDSAAFWNGTAWLPLDVKLPGSPYILAIAFDARMNLYVGFSTNGSATSATVTVKNLGSAIAYPVVTFTGPGTLWQLKNYTTGKAIYFNLTLLAGEIAVLNLNPDYLRFTSSFRGEILNTILPGSNLIFPVMPGANNISAYFYGNTSGVTAITMALVNLYWSIDGAVFK